MGYLTTSTIAADPFMQQRVAAAAAQQGCASDAGIDPLTWTKEWSLTWAASPGWDTSWEAALADASKPPGYQPGTDEAVIQDANILAQVQSMMPFTRIGAAA